MKINHTILSIPPHISTSWKNIVALHIQQNSIYQKDLIVTLTNNSTIAIPNLDDKTIETIFNAHAIYLEQDSQSFSLKAPESRAPHPFSLAGPSSLAFGFPIKMKELDSMGNLGGLMQHTPEQASSPNLPEEMIKKMSAISKVMGLDKQLDNIPKAEPHCNCPYCQIARALHDDSVDTSVNLESTKEDSVSDEELKFREWDLQEIGKDLYEVRNPLDATEHYQVFIGSPIGCTCGCKDCEHIKAVLNS